MPTTTPVAQLTFLTQQEGQQGQQGQQGQARQQRRGRSLGSQAQRTYISSSSGESTVASRSRRTKGTSGGRAYGTTIHGGGGLRHDVTPGAVKSKRDVLKKGQHHRYSSLSRQFRIEEGHSPARSRTSSGATALGPAYARVRLSSPDFDPVSRPASPSAQTRKRSRRAEAISSRFADHHSAGSIRASLKKDKGRRKRGSGRYQAVPLERELRADLSPDISNPSSSDTDVAEADAGSLRGRARSYATEGTGTSGSETPFDSDSETQSSDTMMYHATTAAPASAIDGHYRGPARAASFASRPAHARSRSLGEPSSQTWFAQHGGGHDKRDLSHEAHEQVHAPLPQPAGGPSMEREHAAPNARANATAPPTPGPDHLCRLQATGDSSEYNLVAQPTTELLTILSALLHQITTGNDALRQGQAQAQAQTRQSRSGSASPQTRFRSSALSTRWNTPTVTPARAEGAWSHSPVSGKARRSSVATVPELDGAPIENGMNAEVGDDPNDAQTGDTDEVTSTRTRPLMLPSPSERSPSLRPGPPGFDSPSSLTSAATSALNNPSSYLAFHARNVPSISIDAYLARILKYCPATNEVFLSLLVYFDRMSNECERVMAMTDRDSHGYWPSEQGLDAPENEPLAFIVDSFNIHRLIIAGITVASKLFSDVFYSNTRYAKVGGLPLTELNTLELQFLLLLNFRLVVSPEEMQQYANKLILWWAERGRPGDDKSNAETLDSAMSEVH